MPTSTTVAKRGNPYQHLVDLLTSSTTKFATYLKTTKIHPERLLVASHKLEALTPEDRAIRHAKKVSTGKDDEASKAARAKKPRTGRPVTERLLADAIAGKTVSGPAKTRLVRAVNAIHAARKQDVTEVRKLF